MGNKANYIGIISHSLKKGAFIMSELTRKEQLSRTVQLIGEKAVDRLVRSRVIIFGIGGISSILDIQQLKYESSLELVGTVNDLLIKRMSDLILNGNNYGLIHLIAGYKTYSGLSEVSFTHCIEPPFPYDLEP